MEDESVEGWPLVAPNDGGIRPAGPQNACFYCRQKIGDPHARDCVMVTKRVRVRYSIELEVEVPHCWDQESVEFHRNEGTWCANNALEELQQRFGGNECMCGSFHCEFVADTDTTPRRELNPPGRSDN